MRPAQSCFCAQCCRFSSSIHNLYYSLGPFFGARAGLRRRTMLLLLLLPSVLAAEPASAPPKTLRKSISTCPTLGYFFEKQDLPNHPRTCYLCYCNGDGQAVCTIREKDRCEEDDSSEGGSNVEAVLRESKLHRRYRRGLMDLFFNDGKKDVMLKTMAQANEEDCKPKSSKSIGCPPKDWCTGCLVCDCDNNGEWQCHVMSFCENKTPRPKAKKLKKMELNDIDTTGDRKKESLAKAIAPKKNDKRSVKLKKYNSTSTPMKKSTPSKKKSYTTTTEPSTTTKIPSVPKIAVKTLKKFIRKEDLKNKSGVPLLVIKKYISTISPIVSPELLKYKNDSQKLAQILYQQYEATTTLRSQPVKREIKFEKIIKPKPKRSFELKYNARGRKPMNIKEHNEWNEKMKARQTEREQMKILSNANNFYLQQNELLTPEEKIEVERILKKQKKRDKSNQKKKAKVILFPRKRRNKRDVPKLTVVPTNMTDMEKRSGNISIMKANEENTSALIKYEYTVYNNATKEHEKEMNHSSSTYEPTLKYIDATTIDNQDLNEENVTTTRLPNDTRVEVESTTEKINKVLDIIPQESQNFNENKNKSLINKHNETDLQHNSTLESPDLIDSTLRSSTIKNIDMETATTIERKEDVNNTGSKTNNNTNVTENRIRKVYISDIDTIITGLNQYNLQKWRKTNKTNGLIAKIYAFGENNSINKTMNSNATDLEKMLQNFSKNKTKTNSKYNRMIAMKYIKKLYSQLLSTKNNKSRLNNIAVMESICDTFGPCKISTGKIEVLNSKISELISETKRALEVIRIIKGILQLIDGETNNTDNHKNEDLEFKSYVKKINAVLTDTYKRPLTETQMTQMSHIKNNTKIFINSIGKFAFILNDILEIIHSERMRYNNLRKRKILIRTGRRKGSEPLRKIKNLFLKFNVLQNSFMRNMYQAISELETQNENHNYAQSLKYPRDTRYKASVNKYMTKINYNLEKLKDLALKMGGKERTKRNAMDHDDAVQYLLTLMEYLLKRNNPVDSPPVADGIDLLIDAIRRAPDIKPIRNKALTQASSRIDPAFSDVNPESKSSSESDDDSLKNQSENFKDHFSFERKPLNDTRIISSNQEFYGYRRTTSEAPIKPAAKLTTQYVDVEDLVFNGDVIPKVYMATIPVYESADDTDSEKEKPKLIGPPKKLKTKINESASDVEDTISILANKTDPDTDAKIESTTMTTTVATEKTYMTQFDRLNEEYENQIKGKAPSIKSLKSMKHKKTKRLRKKQKDAKSDVSSITKEIDEEKTKKKVVVEEATLRKHVASTEDDPFQMDDEGVSRDISPLDADNNEIFSSYFT